MDGRVGRRGHRWATPLFCVLVFSALVASAAWAAVGAGWSRGITAPLPHGHSTSESMISSVSCWSAGNCSAVGLYNPTPDSVRALVENETAGSWPEHGMAPELPSNADRRHQDAELNAVSCPAAVNCTAVGTYASSGRQQGLLVNESSGVWERGVQAVLPRPLTARDYGGVALNSVSCASAGDCGAVGDYTDLDGVTLGLLLSQVSGRWQRGVAVSPPANAARLGAYVYLNSVSCPSAGNCTAVGVYWTRSGTQALHVSEVAGKWRRAHEAVLPANAARADQDAELGSVWCSSGRNCTAVGDYVDRSGAQHALLLTERGGRWRRGTAARLPRGSANAGSGASLNAISCSSAGHCSAVGYYSDPSKSTQGLLLEENRGRWGRATEARLPANAATAAGKQNVSLQSVSCASARECAAVGYYNDRSTAEQGLMLSETGGKWHRGVQARLPGNALASPIVDLASVSCGSAGGCTAAGSYNARPADAIHILGLLLARR